MNLHDSQEDELRLIKLNQRLQKEIETRKLLEQKLRTSEAQMRAIFEAMSDIVLVISINNELLRNVEIIPTNNLCLHQNQTELVTQTVEQFFQGENTRIWLEKVLQSLNTQQIVNFDYSLSWDNEEYWFAASISPISNSQVLWVARDISERQAALRERKRVEEALKKSEAQERQKAQELEKTLSELKITQAQLLLSEKMASLGSLVAGIAHEINNPTNFIYGNIEPAKNYAEDLLQLISLYQQHYPQANGEISQKIEEIDLDFIAEDFFELVNSMNTGAIRIRRIVESLRKFSHLDEANSQLVDIHTEIDNTLYLLQHRLQQTSSSFQIRILKKYTELPKIECYPSQLNQVFMNILANAIDALEEKNHKKAKLSPKLLSSLNIDNTDVSVQTSVEISSIPTIVICTEIINSEKVCIRIIDNGIGMTEEVKKCIFDPFFSTKSVGKGTGMGLSVSYQIIVENHHGQLKCVSTREEGTEFLITIPIGQ